MMLAQLANNVFGAVGILRQQSFPLVVLGKYITFRICNVPFVRSATLPFSMSSTPSSRTTPRRCATFSHV